MSNLNTEWATLLVEELVRNGVDTFVASPGSRSTPLIAAVARNKFVRCIMHTDERGAAFFAVGYARATGKPAPFICTSGTALANALPAVVEGYQERVPMLLLTADRPPELQDCGSNQTIPQPGIYRNYVVKEFNLPTPGRETPAEYLLTTVDQALAQSCSGPVHLNLPFRKPLEPTALDPSYLLSVSDWLESSDPYTRYYPSQQRMAPEQLKEIGSLIQQAERPLLFLGRLNLPVGALEDLVQTLQWPTFADVLSGYRFGYGSHPYIHNHMDRLDEWDPDLILHLGGPMLSAKLEAKVREWKIPLIHVEAHTERRDPVHRVTHRVLSDLQLFADDLLSMLSRPKQLPIEKQGADEEEHFCTLLSRQLEAGSGLFLASSLSIRQMARYSALSGPKLRVAANRGASGIDGTIATACGYAQGLRKPVTCLLGDLAFLHDVSSLPLIKKSKYPVNLIVLDNDGGEIFKKLPIAQHSDLFERYFRTPHGLSCSAIAEAYGVNISTICTQETS